MFIGKTDVDAETPIIWPPDAKNWLNWIDPDAGKDWGQEKETIQDEMVGWHHRLNGHEFGSTPGVSDGQGGLACGSPWSRRVGHDWATELNKTADLVFFSGYKKLTFSSLVRTRMGLPMALYSLKIAVSSSLWPPMSQSSVYTGWNFLFSPHH